MTKCDRSGEGCVVIKSGNVRTSFMDGPYVVFASREFYLFYFLVIVILFPEDLKFKTAC